MRKITIILNKIARVLLYRLDFPVANYWYLMLVYQRAFGKFPNLKKPKSFSEKINYMKLHDHNPMYKVLTDKIEVKRYVKDKVPEVKIIPTLGVWAKPKDIEWEKLPDRFVLKCNHDSGSVLFCLDKGSFDRGVAIKKLKRALRRNPYLPGREWGYKDVRPRIFAEALLTDGTGGIPRDYKVYCFNGVPSFLVIFYNRYSGKHVEGVYDIRDGKWEKQDFSFSSNWEIASEMEPRPEKLGVITEVAEVLSSGMMQCRVDFYVIRDRRGGEESIYFSEITLYTAGGTAHTVPEAMDREIGKLIQVDKCT